MFVILVYDINQKRVGKVLKVCRKYLSHVQKSVFEGSITELKLKRLKMELKRVIVPEEDSICLYCMASTRYSMKEQIGIIYGNEHII